MSRLFVNQNLRVKILSGFSLVLFLLVILAFVSYTSINKNNRITEEMITKDSEILMLVDSKSANIQEGIALMRGYLLYGDSEYKERLAKVAEESKGLNERLLALQDSEKVRTLIEKSVEFGKVNGQVLSAFERGEKEKALTMMKEISTPLAIEVGDGFKEISAQRHDDMRKAGLSLIESGSHSESIIIILSIVAVLLGIVIALLISQMIVKPILEVVHRIRQVSEGNFTGEMMIPKSNDEVGTLVISINNMLTQLRSLIQQVTVTTRQVSASSEELTAGAQQNNRATESIASTMEQVAAGAENQVRSIHETSRIVNDMSIQISNVSDTVGHIGSAAMDNLQQANEGTKSLQNAERQMNTIQNQVGGLSYVVSALGEKSLEIGKIIEVITTIAAQTNLLALNAAIEAARAGEHGRGFAVVADEVRKLAEQSGGSAQQITQLIAEIQYETQKAVDSMQSVTTEVSQGIEVVHSAGHYFYGIQTAIGTTTSAIEQLHTTIQQLTDGSKHIARTMENISHVVEESASGAQSVSAATEQQVASMEEFLASAQSLTNIAENLQQLVSKFKI